MIQDFHCFVLSVVRYAEQDAIVRAFSREQGHRSFFVKNIYAKKNKKKVFLTPFSFLKFSTQSKIDSDLLFVKNISRMSLQAKQGFLHNGILFFMAELLDKLLRGEGSEYFFDQILLFVKGLEQDDFTSHFVLLFSLVQHLGVSPLVNSFLFLDPYTGTFSPVQTHPMFDENLSFVWKQFLDEQDSFSFSKRVVLESILCFLEIHVADFTRPKSLEVLQQVYRE